MTDRKMRVTLKKVGDKSIEFKQVKVKFTPEMLEEEKKMDEAKRMAQRYKQLKFTYKMNLKELAKKEAYKQVEDLGWV